MKKALLPHFARIGQALASGHRLELIDLLAQAERSVEELARETGLSVANTSQHLQVLRRVHLVESRQEGTYVYYRLADPRVFRLWQALRDAGEAQLADVERLLRGHRQQAGDTRPVGMAELSERLRGGRVVVFDVRPRREYEAGHIAGARWLGLDDLEGRVPEIPPEAEVVVYCRGPYCVFADEAVARLRRHGLEARRLDLGFPDWRAAGLPVEQGEATGEAA